MGGIAGPALAAAVSEAGGLGILAGHAFSPEELRANLAAVRERTDRSFGVNLLLPDDLRDPVAPTAEAVEGLRAAVRPLREELGLPELGDVKAPARDVEEKLEIALAARPAWLSVGLADPGAALVARCHALGIRVMAMVTTVADARRVAASGVDAIVAQGAEAGGHRSHFVKPGDAQTGAVGTMALVPEVVDAVEVPVIAAGGISDGRGLVAALALGAAGVMMGTRFLATQEAEADAREKLALLEREGSDTVISDVASGRYARMIRSRLTETYDGAALPFGWHGSALAETFAHARATERLGYAPIWAGQSVGLVRDLPTAAEVVRRVMDEAEDVRRRLK